MPENTLAAFEYAIAAGADAIEMDVWVTRDDVPVVVHNPRLRWGAAIRRLAFDDLRRRAPHIPSLDEVLALAPRGDFLFNVEIKSFRARPLLQPRPRRYAELVLERICRAAAGQRAIVQSFDFRILRAIKELAPELPLAALCARGMKEFPAIAARACAAIVAPHARLVTAERVRGAHEAGVRVVPWTVNRQREWESLIAAGVDGIITDNPAGLVAYLRWKGLR